MVTNSTRGIYCTDFANVNIKENTIKHNLVDGIECDKSTQVVMDDNSVEDNNWNGVSCHGDSTIKLINNNIIPDLSVKAGDRISVPIILENADDMLAGGVTISFDPTVLRPIGVMSKLDGAFFQSKIDGDELRFAFVSVVDLAIHSEQFDRSGTLAVIEFEPISNVEGMTTELRIDHAQIAESLSVKVFDGSIEFLPSKSVLLQNYPNPFNPETWIPFKLSNEADVQISIYDVDGNLVKMIALGNLPAGVYVSKKRAAYWDGCNNAGEKVSSGVYFYHLQAGGYSATKRMLIVK